MPGSRTQTFVLTNYTSTLSTCLYKAFLPSLCDPEGSRTPDLCGFNTALSHTTELQDHLVEQFNVLPVAPESYYSGHPS